MKNLTAFQLAVDRFIDEASPVSMDALIAHARLESITDSDIAYLALSCAESDGWIWDKLDDAADVASTGGPTSLTTLVCPLYLRALGNKVPKLGVSGRPAGGIDVLAQIPGFKYRLTSAEAVAVLNECGYVHFLAGEEQGRHDAILFSHRKVTSATNIPLLAIASLVTKKLAVGVSRVGLDVRVSPFGNFGGSWFEAKQNAKRFCAVAKILGISAVCFLTDGSQPYQPYVGRGESLAALADILSDKAVPDLSAHVSLCYAMAQETSGSAKPRPSIKELRFHFGQNLLAQGTSLDRFFEKASLVVRAHQFPITAAEAGFLNVDIGSLRQILVAHQSTAASEVLSFPDPVGVVLRSSYGAYVSKGETVATVRADESQWLKLHAELSKAFWVSRTPSRAGYFEEVTNA